MGEIADMMLEGILCQHCGGYIGSACGYPRSCCEPEPSARSLKRRSIKADAQAIGEKAKQLLERVCHFTDTPTGMYPGIHWEDAPGQLRKLKARGFVDVYEPHNRAHKNRAVITNAGRAILEVRKQ